MPVEQESVAPVSGNALNAVPGRQAVAARVFHLLREVAGIPPDRISETATIDDQLRMQSVTFVELQVALEEEYDIQVDPVHVVELNELGAIIDYIHRCAMKAAASRFAVGGETSRVDGKGSRAEH